MPGEYLRIANFPILPHAPVAEFMPNPAIPPMIFDDPVKQELFFDLLFSGCCRRVPERRLLSSTP